MLQRFFTTVTYISKMLIKSALAANAINNVKS
jgi:hypothetical protein